MHRRQALKSLCPVAVQRGHFGEPRCCLAAWGVLRASGLDSRAAIRDAGDVQVLGPLLLQRGCTLSGPDAIKADSEPPHTDKNTHIQ